MDVYVNIESTIDIKIAACRAHKSQMKDLTDAASAPGRPARGKGKEMAYAEGFRVVTLVSDEDWEKRITRTS